MSSTGSEPTQTGPTDAHPKPTIADFYDEDPRRRQSDEIEYGDGWTRHADVHATYRLSHVLDTGELYVVREPHPGGILARYLDQLNVDQADPDQLTVEILATVPSEEADQLFDGWQDAMTGTNSLPWVEERLAARGHQG
jgi:hypothetical protein